MVTAAEIVAKADEDIAAIVNKGLLLDLIEARPPCRARIKFRIPGLDFLIDDAVEETDAEKEARLLEYRLACAKKNVLPFSMATFAVSSVRNRASYGSLEIDGFDGALWAPGAYSNPGALFDLFDKTRPNYAILQTYGEDAFNMAQMISVPAFLARGFAFWSADLTYRSSKDGKRLTYHEWIGDPAL